MEEILPTVSVRQLISVYEQGVPSEFKRPRAASLGNVLGKNVIVRSHNYQTLSDIEDALKLVEVKLNSYQSYNKRKHVEFQETLFTLLTSVINIEADANDDPLRKKKLITQTQKFVSVLNQKLPNSGSVSSPTTKQIFEIKAPEEQVISPNKVFPPSETQKQILENEYSISVQSLKQNFQSKTTVTFKNTSQNHDSSKKVEEINKLQLEEPSNVDKKLTQLSTVDDVDSVSKLEKQEPEKPEEPISVTKLRNMFEQKEKENKTGLELLIKPKTFQYQVFIPYTAESLGTYRFFRANSGHYMNEIGGVLNRVNITKAKSTADLNSYSYRTFKERENNGEEDNESLKGTSSGSEISIDGSDCESLESVKELKAEKLEIAEDESRNSLSRSFSVKEAVDSFENICKDEEVHIHSTESSDIEKQILVHSDENESSLSLSVTMKETLESFENICKDEEVRIQTTGSSDIEKQILLENDENESSLTLSVVSVKETVESFQNIHKDEKVHTQATGSSNIENQILLENDESENSITLSVTSVKETVESFENICKDEEVHSQATASSDIEKQILLENDESENSLSLSVSVKETVESFENICKEEEVHIETAETSAIEKQTLLQNGDSNRNNLEDEDDVFISQTGSINDYNKENKITPDEPAPEITSISQISIDSVALKDAESRFQSLIKKNDVS